jgi:hypothetical protein
MKKHLLISALIIISSFGLKAQTWFPLGNNWNTGITAMDTLGGEIYAAGDIWCYDTITLHKCRSYIKTWNSAKWDTVLAFGGVTPDVPAITTYTNNIYFMEEQIGVCELTGKTYTAISNNAYVTTLLQFGGSLYAGGQFTVINGVPANNIASWNGTLWSPLGGGTSNYVFALTVYNGQLVAGGNFNSAGGISADNIAMWNGTKWDSIGHGLNGTVNALTTYNGNLYAGGTFDSAGGIAANNIAEWNGTKWLPLGAGITGNTNGVLAFTVYNNNLIVGGGFDSAGGKPAHSIAQWNGTAWDTIGQGVNGIVRALTVYDGFLCVAGNFDSAGGKPITDIAGWCIGCPAGVNDLQPENEQVKVFPNPSNGRFTIKEQGIRDKEQVDVYNMLGEKIYSATLTSENTTIDLQNKSEGIYFYKIISTEGNHIEQGKLILQ